ncbi:ArsR family transcriptional regulator [Mesorhizobium sp. BR1-1-16]|uniref:ArsR/SmtB family transcription factor n=1 Tax=Mesorhizobium sp. BR1-1-16 TaxID=2876653 RepID=UPI001CD033DC|nr:helix-turn-helix transcriptional regulator [Mesorhizobium sp. BR1-1-16]MBZ9937084.1 ArsR family transcriptional regulator [Mesorhizobium sp. BR1-1-16]
MSSTLIELCYGSAYPSIMAKELLHPDIDQIDLSAVLDALSDPTRREIVAHLTEVGEDSCGSMNPFSSKTNLTYHLARLREAGVTRTRIDGARRLISVRAGDIEQRFPGLLPAVLTAVRAKEPS